VNATWARQKCLGVVGITIFAIELEIMVNETKKLSKRWRCTWENSNN
jgi:hypothetical protein